MATSVRFPEMLKREAAEYARSLGISVNALVAVALRAYLDGRPKAPPVEASADAPAALQPSRAAQLPRQQRRALERAKGKR